MNTELIAAFAGAFVAGLVGLFSSRLDRNRDGRDRFLAEIGLVEADLDAAMDMRPISLKEFHLTSREQIRRAVFAVQPFIRKVSFERLLELLEKYKRITDEQLTVMTATVGKRLHQFMAPDVANPVKNSDELLREYLTTLRRIVG